MVKKYHFQRGYFPKMNIWYFDSKGFPRKKLISSFFRCSLKDFLETLLIAEQFQLKGEKMLNIIFLIIEVLKVQLKSPIKYFCD